MQRALKQKSHTNDLSRLMEIIANSVEHGGAQHIDVCVDFPGSRGLEPRYIVSEVAGRGLQPEELRASLREYGRHRVHADAGGISGYSHNGIGTKAPLSIFSSCVGFSVHAEGENIR
eukprot:SAG31_NODE_10754_length_1101_cov_2.912176_1_plen_117_part_00